MQHLSEVAALGASKENISDNAEVLSSLSRQLRQLITRADRLQQQHEALLCTESAAGMHACTHAILPQLTDQMHLLG